MKYRDAPNRYSIAKIARLNRNATNLLCMLDVEHHSRTAELTTQLNFKKLGKRMGFSLNCFNNAIRAFQKYDHHC